ncbi:MAG: zinc-dependent peptidase [Saprospiraceae bacterium]
MPAYRLAIPVFLMLALSAYLTYWVNERWSVLIIISLIILVAGYILMPQINWWWWKRYPPDISKELVPLLDKFHPYYRTLTEEEQREFRKRLFLFMQGHNYMPQVTETVPQDVQLMIAAAPVAMTFRQEDFLFPHFENIVTYPHIFPSPQYPEQFHASEVYAPDGVLMFCMEHVVRGFTDPVNFLNPSWYEYAKVFRLTNPTFDYGTWEEADWIALERISRFSKDALERWVGLKDLDITAMAIAFFFIFPQAFRRELPEKYLTLQTVFHQN